MQQPQRHARIMPDERSPLAASQARLLAPHGLGPSQAVGAGGQLSCRALFSFLCGRHAANTSTTF